MTYAFSYPSPVGKIWLSANAHAIVSVTFGREPACAVITPTQLIEETASQLDEYFRGHRTEFTLPLDPQGTDFQKRVWNVLKDIPYGQTRSYAWVAGMVGCTRSYRAIGGAGNRNPIPIIIPCHRMIGSDGQLKGYAGGLDIKRRLLDLENGGWLFP